MSDAHHPKDETPPTVEYHKICKSSKGRRYFTALVVTHMKAAELRTVER